MSAALLEEFGTGDAREREESWRYSKTALRALAQQDFTAADANAPLTPSLLERFDWAQTRGRRAVFVNGAFCAAHSDLSAVGAAVAIRHDSQSGFVLTISAPTDAPLHLVYASVPASSPSRWQASSEILVTARGVSLIEQHVGEPGRDVLGALSSQIRIAAQADLQITTLSDLADSTSLYRHVRAEVENDAAYRMTHAILGGRLQRFDLDVQLIGARSLLDSRGVFALRGRQHADIHLDVRHVARDTACDILWRGVADERARGVFRGAITVAARADGADARLSNKNLLLSEHAEIDTQPVLEIYADEVKAAHGATVGQIDERALFYLRSRGIPLEAARRLMITAFCNVALDRLPHDELRTRLAAMLMPHLDHGLSA